MRNEIFSDIKFRTWIIYILCFVLSFFLSCSRQPLYPEPSRAGSGVVVDVRTLIPEIPIFFTYHYHNRKINFFVIKINDKVLSFLDACTKCYPAKLGYRFDNGYIICRACNVRYSISEVEKGFGSCLPIQITGHFQGGKFLILLSEFERMADKF